MGWDDLQGGGRSRFRSPELCGLESLRWFWVEEPGRDGYHLWLGVLECPHSPLWFHLHPLFGCSQHTTPNNMTPRTSQPRPLFPPGLR